LAAHDFLLPGLRDESAPWLDGRQTRPVATGKKAVAVITAHHIPASRRADLIASTLVSLKQRMNILTKPDDGTGSHGLVGLSVQIFLCGLDDVHGYAGLC
jgi:hypothetical protein